MTPPELDELEAPTEETAEQNGGHTPEPSGTGSVLDRIKARRRELQQERHIDLPIPNYNGDLWARYRPLPSSKRAEIGVQVEKSKDPLRGFWAQIRTLLSACEMILVRNPDHPDADERGLVPIDPEAVPPVAYDERLAALLDIKVPDGEKLTGRRLLREVFGGKEHDAAISSQFDDFVEWQRGADEESDEELLGES